ncbi:MAG TPA: globin [Acidimicrobiales bacterium]|nr:globin [Acidimicrobiales bacterium]
MTATMFERVGGKPFFDALTKHFYAAVAEDPTLRPLYPDDLTEAREHLRDFLVQYWGGPGDYSATRGHPRLRMRHAPFVIGLPERDAWFRHMAAAVAAAHLPAEDEQEMLSYFAAAATHLVNDR